MFRLLFAVAAVALLAVPAKACDTVFVRGFEVAYAPAYAPVVLHQVSPFAVVSDHQVNFAFVSNDVVRLDRRCVHCNRTASAFRALASAPLRAFRAFGGRSRTETVVEKTTVKTRRVVR